MTQRTITTCISNDATATRRAIAAYFTSIEVADTTSLRMPATAHDPYTIGLLRGRLALTDSILKSLKET